MKNVSSLARSGFTFIEILAVVSLIAIVFGIATLTFRAGKARLANTAYQFTKDVQGLYAEALRTGKIHRLQLSEKGDSYTLDIFEMPKPRPKPEEREAYRRWEDEQREIAEKSKDKDSASLTRLDRGLFRTLKKRSINESIKIKHFLTPQNLEDENKQNPSNILFYPSGETDQVLIVLEDISDKIISLEVEPLSGRVKTTLGEITKEEWKKGLGIK